MDIFAVLAPVSSHVPLPSPPPTKTSLRFLNLPHSRRTLSHQSHSSQQKHSNKHLPLSRIFKTLSPHHSSTGSLRLVRHKSPPLSPLTTFGNRAGVNTSLHHLMEPVKHTLRPSVKLLPRNMVPWRQLSLWF